MALPEFANFTINRIITHEIFQRDENREIIPPTLSSQITLLDQEGKAELAARIVEAIGKDSKSVEMQISNIDEGSVYNYVKNILDNIDDANFISKSQNIARNLARAQSSRNLPGGILVVIEGTTGLSSSKYVAIIKAELQGGFQKSQNNTIEYVKDLLLTPQQKLYKIGVFMEKDSILQRFFVFDFNMSQAQENGMAVYFYNNFLGCSILHTDKYFTNKFYFETKKFIDESKIFSDDEVFDLHTHLYSYLKSQSTTINIGEFANEYINDVEKRDTYSKYMSDNIEEGFNRSITKDISDIKSKLKMRKLIFTNRVKISAPSDEFEENVQVLREEEREDGSGIVNTILSIAGKISKLDQ